MEASRFETGIVLVFLFSFVSSDLVVTVSPDDTQQIFLREPNDQIAIQGEHVTLPCRVKNKKGMLQWTRDGFGLGIDRNLSGFHRYNMRGMMGSDEEGDYTLDINPVQLEDDAQFQCQVGAAEGVAPIRSRDAKLTVHVPPEAPIIINGAELRTTEDRETDIKCVSRGGKPAAEITWLDGSGTVITEGITKETEEVENTKRVTAISTLKFTAKKTHHNTSLTCQAQNPADRQPKSATIHLMVEYAPHVTIKADHSPISEGDDVTFSCVAHANPTEMTYRWFLDNEIVPGNHGTEYRIKGISRLIHNKIVKCEVNNVIGKSEETETLDINYAPKFLVTPSDVSGEKGQNAVLTCKVDGNPAPTYTWFRNGDLQTVHSYESELKVAISELTIGKYICRASVKGFREVTSAAEVFMKGPPRIFRKDPIQFGHEGDNIELTCESFGIPAPDTIVWSQYGFTIDAGSSGHDHYAIREDKRKDGIKSVLIIRKATSSDFGDYNCTVKTSHGEDAFSITLKREKSLPLIIILSAVIGGIVITVAAILIMILCRRSTALSIKSLSTGVDEKSNGSNLRPPMAPSSVTTTSNTVDHLTNAPSTVTDDMTTKIGHHETDDWDGEDDLAETRNILSTRSTQQNFLDYPAGMDLGFNDGYGYGPYGLAYQAQLQPPPPPPHPNHQLNGNGDYMHNQRGNNGLNVSDPRLAAKYGNPYLTTSPTSGPMMNGGGVSPLISGGGPGRFNQAPGGRQYATLYGGGGRANNGNGSYSPVHAVGGAGANGLGYATMTSGATRVQVTPKSKPPHNNYTGTMLGNGSMVIGGKGGRAANSASAGSHPTSQYILSPDSADLKANAMATHV